MRKLQNNGIVNIHGKEYMTVARRLEIAHAEKAIEGVETEVLNHNPVVIKAKVMIKGQVYTGISSVDLDSSKLIEKQNPYEVAETSATGRALGFAGFGLVESVASADEVVHALSIRVKKPEAETLSEQKCAVCGERAIERKGINKLGKPYHGLFCSSEDKSHTQWFQVLS